MRRRKREKFYFDDENGKGLKVVTEDANSVYLIDEKGQLYEYDKETGVFVDPYEEEEITISTGKTETEELREGMELKGTRITEYDSCPYAKGVIHISPKVYYTIIDLLDRIPTEFALYLLGHEENGEYYIDGIYLPEQEATSSDVEITEDMTQIPEDIRKRIIGHFHSHANMESFFSGTDFDHFNYPVHIVGNKRHDFKAVIRKKVPCGIFLRIQAKISVEHEKIPVDISKIKRKTYSYPYGHGKTVKAVKDKEYDEIWDDEKYWKPYPWY